MCYAWNTTDSWGRFSRVGLVAISQKKRKKIKTRSKLLKGVDGVNEGGSWVIIDDNFSAKAHAHIRSAHVIFCLLVVISQKNKNLFPQLFITWLPTPLSKTSWSIIKKFSTMKNFAAIKNIKITQRGLRIAGIRTCAKFAHFYLQ